jgi:hypothetical protein
MSPRISTMRLQAKWRSGREALRARLSDFHEEYYLEAGWDHLLGCGRSKLNNSMSGLVIVILLSLLPGAGNFLGGMAAEVGKPSPRFLNWSLHAVSGIVVAIVAIELMPEARCSLTGWWIALAFLSGGVS